MTHAVTERRTVMDGETQVIWSEFSHRLRAFIRQRVANEADAEDILQDVFLRIHLHAGGVNRADRLTSWLYQVTRNAIVDYYRAPARREQPDIDTESATLGRTVTASPVEEIDLDAAQAREALASCLRPMVERLPPHYREAVALVDLAGLAQPRAAARLGLSVSGMKSRVQRGRRALKQTLVACCPVQLDTGGRIVGYDPPDRGCGHCAGPGEGDVLVAASGSQRSRCCESPAAGAG